MMQELMGLLAEHGVLLVFASVLVEQLGAPIPAVPMLVIAGALAADGHFPAWQALAVALAAALAADAVWYLAGRRHGHRVLKTICRISISPDSCVRQTEDFFERWGATTLVFAKFIPGLSTVAPPLAGAMNIGWGRFLVLNGVGALVWAGLSIGAGLLFHAQVDVLLGALEAVGAWALVLLLSGLAGYVAWKWWERRKVLRALAVARITPDELYRLMDEGHDPVILDVRSRPKQTLDLRRIPGAIAVHLDALPAALENLPADREIVAYCACPNEVSAAKLAGILLKRGFKRVRPLLGGIDAWEEAGYRLEGGQIHKAHSAADERGFTQIVS